MRTNHTCPHGGIVYDLHDSEFLCGHDGQLCPMCREDRADARTRQLVEGLALAGVLASPDIKPDARSALRHAAALRDLEGGDG